MMPAVQLLVNGKVLINEGLGSPGTREAFYQLVGNPKKLTKTVRNGNFEISYFKQQLSINSSDPANPDVYFLDDVVCRQDTYVGIPIP